MIELIKGPWHWSIAGFLIGLTVPILLILGNKNFGISSTLRHTCAAILPANISFFKYDWKKEIWNMFFVAGIFLGGVIASLFLQNPADLSIAPETVSDLKALGINSFSGLLPLDIFGTDQIFSLRGFVFMALGGFLVGFGTRYGAGCTSGHAIMGLSTLQWPSLVATCCFMAGGMLMTHFGFPFIFKLLF